MKNQAADTDDTSILSVTVVLVDPHEATREGLALLLERAGCTVAGTLGVDDDTVEAIDRLCPDVVLLDADDRPEDRLALAITFHASTSAPSVVLHVADPRTPAFRRRGARGHLRSP